MKLRLRRLGWPFLVVGLLLMVAAGLLLRESGSKLAQAREISKGLHGRFPAQSGACGYKDGMGEEALRAYLACLDAALRAKGATSAVP